MPDSSRRTKPAKPRADFPLFPHARGYWAKKICGKLHYFGRWDDPEGSLAKYLDQKDALHAGRKPRTPSDGCTLHGLCNAFMAAKERQLDADELSPRTFDDYHRTCRKLLQEFGRERPIDDLHSEDFGKLRAKWAKRLGVHALAGEVQQARTVFKFAYDSGLIDRPVKFGPEFKQPSKKAKRAAKQAAGPKMFEAEELRAILSQASQPMHAMILLGVNCGFGNYDCGALPQSAIDFDGKWIDYPRHKTAIERRCPLWPETVKSLHSAIGSRPTPRDDANSELCFITRYGNRWAHDDRADSPISKAFRKLLDELGLHRRGLGFYSLSHVFQTTAGESRDPDAVRSIMGHIDNSMSAEYRERISDKRLRDCTNHVRRWLFPRRRAAK